MTARTEELRPRAQAQASEAAAARPKRDAANEEADAPFEPLRLPNGPLIFKTRLENLHSLLRWAEPRTAMFGGCAIADPDYKEPDDAPPIAEAAMRRRIGCTRDFQSLMNRHRTMMEWKEERLIEHFKTPENERVGAARSEKLMASKWF